MGKYFCSFKFEAKTVRSLEETIAKVIELNKLEEFVKIESKRPENAQVFEKLSILSGSKDQLDRRDICRNKACLDSKISLPPIKRTDSQNNAWDIKGIGVPPGECFL